MVSKKDVTPQVVILTGPTATGKSTLALDLANRFGKIEIVNADSMLVYRGLDIGTAKPTKAHQEQIPHHLIDIRNPDQPFTAGEFQRSARSVIQEIHSRGNRTLIVGGTGFYLKSLLFGLWQAPPGDPAIRETLDTKTSAELFDQLNQLDSKSALRIGKADRYRLIRALELIELSGKTPTELESLVPQTPDPQFALWVVDRPMADLQIRIKDRTQQMLHDGFIDEVTRVRDRFPKSRVFLAVGYAQVCDYLDHIKPSGRKLKPGLDGLAEEIELATRQLVKSQRTWFKNQQAKVPGSRSFSLEDDRASLEDAFESVYGPGSE